MKKGIKFLAILAISLLAFGGNGVFAEGNTPSFLTQELTEIDVTVTDRVTFHVGSGTNNATVSPITVTNNLKSVPVVVTNIRATANAGYTLNTYNSDFAGYGADSKHFGMAYSSNDISGNGYEFEDELAAEGNKAYNFTGKSTIYTSVVEAASNTQLANIIFTVSIKQPLTTTMFDTGRKVNIKLKKLAGQSNPSVGSDNTTITAIDRADALPNGFTPNTNNTISAADSEPIYAWFKTNTIYYYSDADILYLNPDSSQMFNSFYKLNNLGDMSSWNTSEVTNMIGMFSEAGTNATDFSLDLSSWDTSKVTNMSNMFLNAASDTASSFSLDLSEWNTSNVTDMSNMFDTTGCHATTWSVDLSGWDTSKVTNMGSMFYSAGQNATTWSVDLSGWDTSSVTNMRVMFSYAGYYSTTWSVNLSGWNASNVTNMSEMFSYAGYYSTTWSVDLSGWDTSKVTNIYSMFYSAGQNATTWSVDLSGWNTSNVTNMSEMFNHAGENATTWSTIIPQTNNGGILNTTSRMYGSTESVYEDSPYDRSFTLAQ